VLFFFKAVSNSPKDERLKMKNKNLLPIKLLKFIKKENKKIKDVKKKKLKDFF
jgi:hypothetical protein